MTQGRKGVETLVNEGSAKKVKIRVDRNAQPAMIHLVSATKVVASLVTPLERANVKKMKNKG